MKKFNILFVAVLSVVAVLAILPSAEASVTETDYLNVQIHKTHNGISHKEFTISIQNKRGVLEYIDVDFLFENLSFNRKDINNLTFYEYKMVLTKIKTVTVNYLKVPVYDNFNKKITGFKDVSVTSVSYVDKWVNEWVPLSYDKIGKTYKDNDRQIKLPALKSEAVYDSYDRLESVGGTRTFKVAFDVPIAKTDDGFGSSGLFNVVINGKRYGSGYVGEEGSSWWSSDWDYGAEVTLTTHPDNYQINVFLTKADNLGGFGLDNFDDLRVTENIDAGELPIFRENWNLGDNVSLWFKRLENDSPDYDNTVYFWWGNSDAGNVDDGENVFVLFDDYNDASLDAAKWTSSRGTPAESGGLLVLDDAGGGETVTSVQTFGIGYALRLSSKFTNAYSYQEGGFSNTYGEMSDASESAIYSEAGAFVRNKASGSATTTTGLEKGTEIFWSKEICRDNTTRVRYYIRDKLVATHTTNISSAVMSVNLNAYQTSIQHVDWAFVRYCTATEPTVTIGNMIVSALTSPSLATPENGATLNYGDNTLFSWTDITGAENYRVEISSLENFGSTVENTTVTDNETYFIIDYDYGSFWWRVWAENVDMTDGENISETWNFELIAVVEKGYVIVSTGSFEVDENVTIYAQVLNENGLPINDNTSIEINIFDSSYVSIVDDTMTYVTASNGVYSYSTIFSTVDIYICEVAFPAHSAYGSNNIIVTAGLNDIFNDLIVYMFIILLVILGVAFMIADIPPLVPIFSGFILGVIGITVMLPVFPFVNLAVVVIGVGEIISSLYVINKGKK